MFDPLNIEHLGTKVVFLWKYEVKFFMRWIILELLIFVIFFIDAYKYSFETITSIHAAFINKIDVFHKISIREISNIPSILYFSHILIFNTVLETISRMILFQK